MAGELRKKTLHGAGWSFIDNIANYGVSFIVGLILARMLTPQEYGLIGIILIFIALFNTIVDSGFSNALIRNKDAKEIDYNTVFFVNLAVSLLLFVICYFSAPVIATFFNEPQLTPLTRVMGIVVVINAFAIIQRTILIKKINFKIQTKVSLVASVGSGIIGIVMAVLGMGVWSLVAQQISRQLLNTIFLWLWNSWRPRMQFSFASFKEHFGFGWKLLTSSVIDTVWREIYQVVIGKYYAAAALGEYTRAKQFGDIFSSNMTSVVQRVTYPVLSSIQDDKDKLKYGYRRIIKTTMFIAFVCMLMLAAVSRPMIEVLIGNQWGEAAKMLPILCFNMMLYPLHAINLNMLQVQGRSDLFLRLEIIKKCIAVIPLCLGIFVGIYWMLWGSLCAGLFNYYLNSYYSGKFLNYDIITQIKDISPSFFLASVAALMVYAVSFIPMSLYIVFPVQLVVGLVAVIVLSEIFKIDEYKEIKKIVQSAIIKIGNGK